MNRNKLKTFAPQARREFIQAVTDRAAHFGLSAEKIEPMTEKGDVALIGGRSFPKAVGEKRKKLEARIHKLGFGQTMEAVAYSWFNRLVAIRFMELHGYLEHGYRVLSHPDGRSQPEILEHAAQVDLPGVDQQKVIALKLEGTKEEELYRMLLVGQCNALHKALPFLFEAIDDETELLLPDHLLHSDSLIRKLVNEIPEEDWQEVEIIGWLYQFYISEKKDEVIGKVVKSEDIPAATQLFTPNWIVKYLVQNSLGRQWVATYPHSPLKAKMEYYIEPAEQTPEVQTKLAEITPTSINPEELTLLDPACGSGHILVEAYDLLKIIYQERGYRAKDIPRLILEKNLFGLEIDDRAAQLAAFALMMKARADDRSIFERDVQPHILSMQESKGLDAKEITEALNQPILKEQLPPSGELFEEIADAKSPLFGKRVIGVKGAVSQADVAHLISLFEDGKTFGSLIQVPEDLAEKLCVLAERVETVSAYGGMFEKAAARTLRPLVDQAKVLARKYDAVVANPPYMGGRNGMNSTLKEFTSKHFPNSKFDLFATFIERGFIFAKRNGFAGMVTMQSWMFLSSFEAMRSTILGGKTLSCMVHMGNGVMGIAFGTAATVLFNCHINDYAGQFSYCDNDDLNALGVPSSFPVKNARLKTAKPDDFISIPGSPIAYWISRTVLEAFKNLPSIDTYSTFKQGMATSDNGRFLRLWHEVSIDKMDKSCKSPTDLQQSSAKWFPYNKGGSYRKWYGNNEYVVNWQNDGQEMKDFTATLPQGTWVRLKSREYYCLPNITYSSLTSGDFGCRLSPAGFLFDTKGSCIFTSKEDDLFAISALLNSTVSKLFLEILCPTLDFSMVGVKKLPSQLIEETSRIAKEACNLATKDWDSLEESWDFVSMPILLGSQQSVEKSSAVAHAGYVRQMIRMKELEQENNRLFIEAYGLQHELTPEVPDEQITLYRPDREEDIKRLISYSLGCMMGRYSLDEPGLIYAHSGNQGFDPTKYRKFAADDDGIIPLTEFTWFPDDAASRFEKFIATAWPADTLEENLTFVAESLGTKKGETSRDTIRRYLANDFYKHHLSMYKKRPIYWLFSSGKQRGFQALVYLHRYNEGTLARMRTEYVIPLLGKMTARIAHLTDDSAAATSSQHKKRLETEKATITKQLAEVQAFDEQLRHYADQRIKLDLDDGVKVNYGKFGDLLAEVKAVCGTKEED